ncbi:MAG: MobF family relaxase [Opitutaceae bacterium]
MISPKPQLSLKNAREYFRTHLSAGDYYSQKNVVAGEWFGQGAARLNLTQTVSESAFLALCEGNDPGTGKRLTARRNSIRRENGKWVANKRIFYDWTISPPKSVSVIALLQDPRVIDLHLGAVRAALQELETFAETRVRKGQTKDGARPTGNLVAACFRHDTSRELDPHLHTHAVIFNATFDPAENRWKALQTHGMLKAQRFANAVYEHELCRGLTALGYKPYRYAGSFEVEGVTNAVIQRFSKRSRQIHEETAKRVARDGLRGTMADVREQVAHDRRRRKIKEATADRLRSSWFGQLAAGERTSLQSLDRRSKGEERTPADLADILSWGSRHVFERNCVVAEHQVLAAALTRGRGQDFSLPALRDALNHMPAVFAVNEGAVTSREIVQLEQSLLRLATQRTVTEGAINCNFVPDPSLSAEQRRAVAKLMQSNSFITQLRGAAGTGKTVALREVQRGTIEAKRHWVILAPQRQQVLDLQNDGLPARTVAEFLNDPTKLAERTVICLDESGQVGIRDMHRLATIARESGGKLILSGDTRQHGAVAASDALVLLERYANVPVAKLETIRRQEPRLATTAKEKQAITAYRSAVKLASKGDAVRAFDRLDALGWIQQHSPGEGREMLAKHYLSATKRKDRVLVVTQTWNEVDAINAAVRAALRSAGQLGDGISIAAYQAVDLTAAQKQDAGSYLPGTKVFFLKGYGRHARGELSPVVGATEKGITLLKNGRRSPLAYRYAERLVVVRERQMEIAQGDRLQIKWNGRSIDDQPLVNGELVTVRGALADGRISVENDRGLTKVLGPEQRLFNYGYAMTSYSSQGKTVDTVLFADSGCKPATNQKQWYVTISRARRRILVFTPDKAALRQTIAADGHRQLAVEVPKVSQIRSPRRFAVHYSAWDHHPPSQQISSKMRL